LGSVIEAWASAEAPVITLVLGGVRSGKSEVAERLAGPGPGTYLATGLVAPGDDDFADRVARHRDRRPAAWTTVEESRAVPGVLARLHGPVLLDALGTWIANDLRADIDGLVEALVSRRGDTVVVSEEVGLGVHPASEVGRLFADRLGEANRRVAEVADRCLLVVAGRVIDLPAGSRSTDGPPTSAAAATEAATAAPSGTPPAFDEAQPGTSTVAGLRQSVAFLTPLGGAAAPSPAAFPWFPVVGALLGLLLGWIWWAAEDPFGPLAAAALVVAADLALTGALHFDGLLDSADGLLPHLPLVRRLAVMADPNVGAFAVATGATTLLLRTAALAALGAARPLLLAALWSLSRTAMAVTALTTRYARSYGLASSFLAPAGSTDSQPPPSRTDPRWVAPAAVGAVVTVGLALADDAQSVIAVVVAALAAAAVALLARRRIGGFTGDTLGAGGMVAETIGLLTAVAVLRP
jgi:cobalamin 5'-phosphate synthase/cobalamin synthase